jgi:hypothetical protein
MIELKTLAGLVALIFGITLFPFMRGLIRRLWRPRRRRARHVSISRKAGGMSIEQKTKERMRENAILLVNALWHTVRLELRRSKYCVMSVAVVQALLNDSTGEVCNMPELRIAAANEAGASATLDRQKKRASGEVECETCGYKLYDHPELAGRAKGLRITCDGKKVKL